MIYRMNPDRCDPSRRDEFDEALSASTPEKRAAIVRGLKLVYVLLETIKEMGAQGAPEGPLYAAVMGAGFTLENFHAALHLLESRKLIRRSGHVAYFITPPDKIEAGFGPEENH